MSAKLHHLRPSALRFAIIAILFAFRIAGAQNIDSEVPPRPESRVYDDANLFSPDEYRSLSERLLELERETGLQSYVAAFSYVDDASLEVVARSLETAWISEITPGEPRLGVVYAFERGSGKLTFATPREMHNVIMLSTQQGLFRERMIAEGTWPNPSQSLYRVATTVSTDLGERINSVRSRKRWFDGRTMLLFLPLALIGLGVTAALMWMGRGSKATTDADVAVEGDTSPTPTVGSGSAPGVPATTGAQSGLTTSGHAQLFFPTVGVQPRFGAEFGGGSPNEMVFEEDKGEEIEFPQA